MTGARGSGSRGRVREDPQSTKLLDSWFYSNCYQYSWVLSERMASRCAGCGGFANRLVIGMFELNGSDLGMIRFGLWALLNWRSLTNCFRGLSWRLKILDTNELIWVITFLKKAEVENQAWLFNNFQQPSKSKNSSVYTYVELHC